MTELSEIVPKYSYADVNLIGGRVVPVTMRPHTIADMNFYEELMKDENNIKALSKTEPSIISELAWNQFDAETKKMFLNIEFQETDNEGKIYKKVFRGKDILLNSLESVKDFFTLFNCYLQTQGLNGFIQEENLGLKKKEKKKLKAA